MLVLHAVDPLYRPLGCGGHPRGAVRRGMARGWSDWMACVDRPGVPFQLRADGQRQDSHHDRLGHRDDEGHRAESRGAHPGQSWGAAGNARPSFRFIFLLLCVCKSRSPNLAPLVVKTRHVVHDSCAWRLLLAAGHAHHLARSVQYHPPMSAFYLLSQTCTGRLRLFLVLSRYIHCIPSVLLRGVKFACSGVDPLEHAAIGRRAVSNVYVIACVVCLAVLWFVLALWTRLVGVHVCAPRTKRSMSTFSAVPLLLSSSSLPDLCTHSRFCAHAACDSHRILMPLSLQQQQY